MHTAFRLGNSAKPNRSKKLDYSRRHLKMFLPLALTILAVFQQTSPMQVINLQPSQLSLYDLTPIVITKQHLPASFTATGEFTVCFEFTVVFKLNATAANIPVANFGGLTQPETVIISDVANRTFNLGAKFVGLKVPLILIKSTGLEKRMTFHFALEAQTAGLLQLVYWDFISSQSSDKPFDLFKRKMNTIAYKDVGDQLLEIRMSRNSDYDLHVRSVYAVNKLFMPTDMEYDQLYKGVARLQQAIYFYMEPAYSKILYNRSAFNAPPAISGSSDNYLNNLSSAFSVLNGHTNWMLLKFEQEFLAWEVPLVTTYEPPTTSVIINLELYVRNDSVGYLSSSANVRHNLFAIQSSAGATLMQFAMTLNSLDQDKSEATITLELLDSGGFVLTSETITDQYTADLKLSVSSVMLSITFLESNNIMIGVYMKGIDIQPPNIRFSAYYSFDEKTIKYFILGSRNNQSPVVNPAFIAVLFDFQYFHGGYFLSNKGSWNDLSALSRHTLVNVHCQDNPRVSRLSGNVKLDAVHARLMGSFDRCTMRLFNAYCSVANCEICAESECLVCQPGYVLDAALQCKLGIVFNEEYDYLSRLSLGKTSWPEFSVIFDMMGIDMYTINKTSYGRARLDYSMLTSNVRTGEFKLDNDKYFIANYSNLTAHFKQHYLNNAKFSDVYFEIRSGIYSFKSVNGNIEFTPYNLVNLCDASVKPLKGTKLQFHCPNVVVDLSQSLYFPDANSTFDSPPAMTFEYQIGSFSLRFRLKCQNNCDCSVSFTGQACTFSQGMCPQTHQEIVFNYQPLVNECVMCPTACLVCNMGHCLACDPVRAFSNGKVVINGVTSAYEDCESCHSNCTQGCTGSDKADCKTEIGNPPIFSFPVSGGPDILKIPTSPQTEDPDLVLPNGDKRPVYTVCDPDCDECDDNFNCVSCDRYPRNIVFLYKRFSNTFINSGHFYCRACDKTCDVCSSESFCTCTKTRWGLVKYDSGFNTCVLAQCPVNCMECDSSAKCITCKHNHTLVDNSCVLASKYAPTCKDAQEQACRQCADGYYYFHDPESNSTCKKCSTKCLKCKAEPGNTRTRCEVCQSSHLFNSKCVSAASPLLVPFVGVFQQIFESLFSDNSTASTLSPAANCVTRLNPFSTVCLECAQSFCLRDTQCLQCPSNSASCQWSDRLGSVEPTECESQFFLNYKTSKCTKCPPNCLSCSSKKCHQCVAGFQLHKRLCVRCLDPNCDICGTDSRCAACAREYFLDVDSGECQPCPENCVFCSSGSKCLKCTDSHQLDSDSLCAKTCQAGMTYFDPASNKCLPCTSCEFCRTVMPTLCASCDVCKRPCQFEFTRVSGASVALSSNDVVWPDASAVRITVFSDLDVDVTVHNKSLILGLPKSFADVGAVVHTAGLTLRQCSLSSDLPLLLSYVDGSEFFDSRQAEVVSQTLEYSGSVTRGGLVLSALTPQSVSLNSVIVLINLNMLFSYSCIARPPCSGFSYYLHRLSRTSNIKMALISTMRRNEALLFSESIGEFNVKVLPLVSATLLMCVAALGVFWYLSCCFKSLLDQQVQELFPLFRGRHMDKAFMKCFFKIYRKKLSTTKMNLIVKYFRQTKQVLQSSRLTRYVRRLMRRVYKRRFTLVFFVLQSSCIDLAHVSAKYTKLFKVTQATLALYALACAHHILLATLFSICWLRFRELHHFLSLYVKKGKRHFLREYVLLSSNIIFTLFTIVYVYLSMLFGNQVNAMAMFVILFGVYACSVLLELHYSIMSPRYLMFRMLCNVPVLAVLHFCGVQERVRQSLFLDAMFVYLNVSRVVIFLYELIARVDERSVEAIIERLSTEVVGQEIN